VSASAAVGQRPAETLAGFLASLAIFTSLIGIAWHPLRLIPFAILLALVAAAMAPRSRLGLAAVMVCAFSFLAGMAIAVATKHPLW
jgi:hypothetical protein